MGVVCNSTVLIALSRIGHLWILERLFGSIAIPKAKEGESIIIVFVVDVNLARYLIGADLAVYSDLKERCEEDLLREHRNQAEEKVSSLAKRAQEYGESVKAYISTGRFALQCLEVVEKEHPELIVTTRSKRPHWVKRFFGSPIDHLIANAGCPVIEA